MTIEMIYPPKKVNLEEFAHTIDHDEKDLIVAEIDTDWSGITICIGDRLLFIDYNYNTLHVTVSERGEDRNYPEDVLAEYCLIEDVRSAVQRWKEQGNDANP